MWWSPTGFPQPGNCVSGWKCLAGDCGSWDELSATSFLYEDRGRIMLDVASSEHGWQNMFVAPSYSQGSNGTILYAFGALTFFLAATVASYSTSLKAKRKAAVNTD